MTEYKARDFHEPLLAALRDLTGGDVNKAVFFKDAYSRVLEITGIPSLDHYGFNPDGKEKVAQWIQWAFRNLKRKNLVKDTGRGLWSLEMVEPEEEKEPESGMSAISSDTELSNPLAAHSWFSDPYVQSVAIKQTACFGHFSTKSTVCGRCPLQAVCIEKQVERYVGIQKALAAEDARVARIKNKVVGVEDLVEQLESMDDPKVAVGDSRDHFDFDAWVVIGDSHVIADSVCPCCRETIKKGTKEKWLRPKDSSSGRAGRIFHAKCVP